MNLKVEFIFYSLLLIGLIGGMVLSWIQLYLINVHAFIIGLLIVIIPLVSMFIYRFHKLRGVGENNGEYNKR